MFDFLESGIDLDASGYADGGDEAIAISHDVQDATDDTAQSLFDLNPAGIAAGGAIAGVGAGMQSLLDDTQEMRESLGRTGVAMDITTDEANSLARSMSDATFPVDDVVGSMDALAQIGVDSEEEMREVALAADALADATGSSATEVSQSLAPAVQALDGDLSALTDDADAFTSAVRDTGLEMTDVASTIERLDFSQIEDMGLSAADTADLIGQFGEETGFTGRQLRTEFRSAVEGADGDTEALVEELGLGEEAMASLADESGHGSEMTEEYGDAANESLTAMDTLRSGFDDARLAVGQYLGPVSAAAPAMQGLGVAAIAMSTINFSAVIPSLFGVVGAAAPLLPILLPMAGLIAGVGAAWKKGWIDPVETATWAAGRATDAVGWLGDRVMWAAEQVGRFYPPIRVAREVWDRNLFGIQDSAETTLGVVGNTIDWLISKINRIPGVDIGTDDIEDEAPDTDDEPDGSGVGGVPEQTDESVAVPEDDTAAATTTSDRSGTSTDQPSGNTSRRDVTDDLVAALDEVLDGKSIDLDLSINEREFKRLIDDRIDAKVT